MTEADNRRRTKNSFTQLPQAHQGKSGIVDIKEGLIDLFVGQYIETRQHRFLLIAQELKEDA